MLMTLEMKDLRDTTKIPEIITTTKLHQNCSFVQDEEEIEEGTHLHWSSYTED